MLSRGRQSTPVPQTKGGAPPPSSFRRLLQGALVLAAAVAGATVLMAPGRTPAVAQVTTTSDPTTVPPDTTTPPPTTTPDVTAPPATAPPPTVPRPTAPPSPSAVSGGRPRRATTTAPIPRAPTASPGPVTTVDAGALGVIPSLPAPATTIVDPSSSTSAPRSSGVLRRVAAASQTRGKPLASLWWPGALAVAVGALSIVGGRRMRPEIDGRATADPNVLVDLEAAAREAHAPAERMAVELERLRATAPPVNRRRHRARSRSPRT